MSTEKIKSLLQSLAEAADAQDITPEQISELSSLLVTAQANAVDQDAKELLWADQQAFLDDCAKLLTQIPNESNAFQQVAVTIVKSLVRMVMNDAHFVDALFESKIYPAILRLPVVISTTATPSLGTATTTTTTTTTTTESASSVPNDVKPMVTILLSKAFESTSNRDRVSGRTADTILEDIRGDKIVTRTTGFQALGLVTQADLSIGCAILDKEGVLPELMDCVELEPESIQIIWAETLSAACADTKTRGVIASQCSDFLKSLVLKGATTNQHLKGAAAVALTKIVLSESKKDPSVGLNGVPDPAGAKGKGAGSDSDLLDDNGAHLAKIFSTLLKDEKNDSSASIQLNAVEGLAYASIQSPIKQLIISDKALLLSLFRLAEESKSHPLKYGLIIMFNNLTSYRKRLTAEQEQMLRLKKMAGILPNSEGKRLDNQGLNDPLDDETAVHQRNMTLVKLGVMPGLHAIGQQASEATRQSLAQVLRNLVTPTETRGVLVQQGIVRLLMPLAVQPPSASKNSPPEPPTSESTRSAAVQALAKLTITLDPRLTFKNQRIPELVRPLIWLLDSSDQLCQFESLMALTNLGSMGDVQVLALALQDGAIEKMENLQFSENVLVRRAATEALCNMIFFEPVFERYSDPKKSKAKIHLMLALSDTDDFMTRRAASGALAVLSTSDEVCKMIMEQERGLEILRSLIALGVPASNSVKDQEEAEAKAIEDVMADQDAAVVVDHEMAIKRVDELRHRGAECFKNLVTVGGKETSQRIAAQGGVQQLASLIKATTSDAVRYSAMEALKAMSEQGISLS